MSSKTNLSLSRKGIYRICQYGGWSLYTLLNVIFLSLNDTLSRTLAISLGVIFLTGILLTELFRAYIIQQNWMQKPALQILPRVVFINILMGILLQLTQTAIEYFIKPENTGLFGVRFTLGALNFSFVFFFWSLIYFSVHYIENFRRVEIQGLRLQALSRETELNRLKSQLNPHFMFNAMNSIRALVDENPQRAKEAVTQLANILRNTLQLGKARLIPLSQELELVRDYLALESVRLEERLRLEWKIATGSEQLEVPPLMIQTLVENCIKHGIAKIPEGGLLQFETQVHETHIEIFIRNTGVFDQSQKPTSGHGLSNTKQRLDLLYGNRATFDIQQEKPNVVLTHLVIPKSTRT
ncbi:MAG: sensor histidine kinase [Bacteroidia bacterium]